MNINQLKEEFNFRHDFVSDDLDLLETKYPKVKFHNIPEAWIIVIDDFLKRNSFFVKSITQYFGLCCISYTKNAPDFIVDEFKKTEKLLYRADIDLHRSFLS